MTITRNNQGWLVLGTLAALATGPSFAADKPAKDPSRRLQQQLRVVEQEKTQLTQKVAEVEAQAKESEAKAADAQHRSDAAAGRIARLARDLDAQREQAAASKAEQAALTAKLAETEHKLAELRSAASADKQQYEIAIARQRTALAGCSERNARMYKLGNELLDKYEEKSCLASVFQAEPFTGLKRAQVEKMVEEDREKLDKEQLIP